MMPIQSLSAQENANLETVEAWAPGSVRKPDLYVLNDEETRYRHRYLDLILNCEVGVTKCFELFVNKDEICKACTEINDPTVLRQQLAEQLKDPRPCNNEAVVLDETCCTTVEYGLHPTASWGMVVDHLVMLLTDSHCIKEVLLFPTMKPEFKPSYTNDEYSYPSQDNHSSSTSSSSFHIAIVGDIHEDWKMVAVDADNTVYLNGAIVPIQAPEVRHTPSLSSNFQRVK